MSPVEPTKSSRGIVMTVALYGVCLAVFIVWLINVLR